MSDKIEITVRRLFDNGKQQNNNVCVVKDALIAMFS